MKPIRFHPAAIIELDEAADYWDAQLEGLGRDVRSEVAQTLQRIRANPMIYAPVPGTGHRKCLTARFHYAIIYLNLPDCIWIAAIAHTSRRPGYWRGRKPPG